jgi:hypothetical protein
VIRILAPGLRSVALVASALLIAACAASEPKPPELVVDLDRAVVTSEVPLDEVVARDIDGLVLARRAGSDGTRQLSVRHGAAPGSALVVEVRTRDGRHELRGRVPADPGPLVVEIDVPAGQGPVPLADAGRHEFTAIAGAQIRVGIVVEVAEPGTTALLLGGERHEIVTTVPGERQIVFADIRSDRETAVELRGGGAVLRTTLVPLPVTLEEARQELSMGAVVFPSDAQGAPEPARPPGRVTLPADWWRTLLRASGLGYRARDPHGPWSNQSVTLVNTGPVPLNVVVRARVLDADGEPAPAFRPRMRERTGDTGEVSGLLRVPAGGSATASLPFFVDAGSLPEGASLWSRELTVTPLGSSQVLWTRREPLQVRRGSSWISLGFALAVLGGALGTLLIALRLRVWIRSFRTADLVTIAVFATLAFIVSGAATLAAAAVGAVLGPFQIFVTNLVDDVLRYALLVTLITLLPRPGVVALTVLLTWLMRGVTLGAFSPLDIVFVGANVFWLEGGLWLSGITRRAEWTDDPPLARWFRLGVGFGGASLLSSMTGLVVAMVMYRLYYAGWYVTAVLLGPGFLYVLIACALGTSFATSLRKVED